MNTGKCEDRKCDERHRKSCRYFKTESGCHKKRPMPISPLQQKKGKN